MSLDGHKKTLGQANDEIVSALMGLDDNVRQTAIIAACAAVGVDTPIAKARESNSETEKETSSTSESNLSDIRTLTTQKSPKSAIEMACVVAYYLRHVVPESERKSEIGFADIEPYFTQAGFPLPKAPRQVLVDSKAAGYFDTTGRGAYKLNPVGHNLVAHTLPRAASATSVGRKGAKKNKATRRPRKIRKK